MGWRFNSKKPKYDNWQKQRVDAIQHATYKDIVDPRIPIRGGRGLSGKRYGYLRVICRSPETRVVWKCLCDCGTYIWMTKMELKAGPQVSCGCVEVEPKHSNWFSGRKGARSSWMWMRQRCLDPKCPAYPHYGGRGIEICDDWTDFDNFYRDMGDRPEGKCIERLDVNGHYEPGNCVWATMEDQAYNRRNTVRFRHNGEMRDIRQISRDTGMTKSNIRSLIHQAKIAFERKRLTKA